MKKILIAAILTIAFAYNANAQKNVIKFNPLGLVFGNAGLDYERVVSNRQSFQIEAGYAFLNFADNTYRGFAVGAQYRFYLQKKYSAPKGWFAAPFLSYCATRFNEDELQATIFSAGAILGYQWQLEPVAIDFYFGPGYFERSADAEGFDAGFDGIGLKAGLAVGLGF